MTDSVSVENADTKHSVWNWPAPLALRANFVGFAQLLGMSLIRAKVDSACMHAVLALVAAEEQGRSALGIEEINAYLPGQAMELPDSNQWQLELAASPSVLVAANTSAEVMSSHLLVWFAGQLFLARQWLRIRDFASRISQRVQASSEVTSGADESAPDEVACRKTASTSSFEQIRALEVLQKGGLLLVNGGPGTGKTTLAIEIAHAWLSYLGRPIDIVLAAPTGRAAARIAQAWRAGVEKLQVGSDCWLVTALQQAKTSTLHRLLGIRDDDFSAHSFVGQHDAEPGATLQEHLIIVDEASMVSNALMDALLRQALPQARLVLLGDQAQLDAIDFGSPFADLLAEGGPACKLQLTRQWRASHALSDVANLVRDGLVESALAALLPYQSDASTLQDVIQTQVQAGCWDAILQAPSAEQALNASARMRVLCAQRIGPQGSELVNQMIERELRKRLHTAQTWFQGRLIMASKNNYALGVMNGDVGVVWPDATGTLQSYFLIGKPGGLMQLQAIHWRELSGVQSAFAITVHKSQGSEFDEVFLVLGDKPAQLNQPLVYTALTRARARFSWFGANSVMAAALQSRVRTNAVTLAPFWPTQKMPNLSLHE